MNKTVKWILISVVALLVIIVGVKAVAGNRESGVKVAVEKAVRRTITETVNASGKIYPEVEVKISPDVSGEVTELNVAEGDSVRKGQVLARVFADLAASQRDQAAAQVAQSQATVANSTAALEAQRVQVEQDRINYERNKSLFDQKVISKSELETFETRFRASQAQLNAARQNIRSQQAGVQSTRTQLQIASKNLGRTTLVAPMNGIVSSLKIKRGERVAGNSFALGTEMMTISDMRTLEVRVDVGENDVVKVDLGDSADVEVDAYNNRKFKGVVTQIASSTAKSGGVAAAATNDVTNYEVRIRIDPASYADLMEDSRRGRYPFRPGMNASADIKTRRVENVITVPINAVAARVKGSDKNLDDKKKEKKKTDDASGEGDEDAQDALGDDLEEVVFVTRPDGTVEKKVVKTGIQDINYIEITTGLQPGQEVVTAPFNAVSKTLKSGTKIRVVKKDQLFEAK